jgi:hypothetical protein
VYLENWLAKILLISHSISAELKGQPNKSKRAITFFYPREATLAISCPCIPHNLSKPAHYF